MRVALFCSAFALLAAPATAQELATPPAAALGDTGNNPSEQGLADDAVAFTADVLSYDEDVDVVTVTGDVRLVRDGNRLRADTVVWNRRTGKVEAQGNVALTNPGGDTAYGDRIELTDALKDGTVDNLLLVMADGGRLAAMKGTRTDGVTVLDRAAYTPCSVEKANGCPKRPLWQVTAVRVTADPVRHRISYRNARLELLGVPILWLPGLSHPDGAGDGGSGLLVPDVNISRRNGLELALPYFLRFAPNRDLTLTPHLYTGVLPMIEAEYRQLGTLGAFRASGFLTYGDRLPATSSKDDEASERRGLRGYVDASGRFQLSPEWSISGSARYATDKTFLRRYDISSDDRLRSTVNAERITPNSYLSIAGWAVQSLRADGTAGKQPIALPAIDYRRRITDPLLGGTVELQANSLAILRTEGQDTQRAFAGARWDLRRLTDWGQELTLTAYARGDIYHSGENARTDVALYRGSSGWEGRAIGALAADARWAWIGEALGGTQQITPRIQLVYSPPTRNLAIPNEDARAVDLEDSNLFALNRFPGYDRWEDGARITYGGEYLLTASPFSLRAVVGQSYRLSDKPAILPVGTGLSDRYSDFVGRTVVRFGRFLSLTHRYRVDKDNLAVRRNEVDASLGSARTYVSAGYLRLNRNITDNLEDLRDREEVRFGGRVQLARYWAVWGSTMLDLTGRSEDTTAVSDGFSPVRHRLGVAYEDECFEFGLSWKKDYDETGDARRGSTFLFRLAFKNLGR